MKRTTQIFQLFVFLLLGTAILLSGCKRQKEKQPVQPVVQEQEQEAEQAQEKPAVLSLTLPGEKRMFQQHPAIVYGPGKQTLPLVFEPLVVLTPEYAWQGCLASEIMKEGLTYTVTLKEGILFSDGSPVTASHVEQSFEAAIQPGSVYAQALGNVEQCRATSSTTVEFTLLSPDRYFENLLTFPIAKSDGMGLFIGSGPFVLREEKEDALILGENPYYSGEKSPITKVTLLPLPEDEVMPYSLKIGEIQYLYSSLEEMENMNLSNYSCPVNLPNLVFLGAQCNKGPMAQLELRQAVDAALNRESLAQRVYSSKAVPTSGPLPAGFYTGQNSGSLAPELAKSSQKIEALGWQKGEDGLYHQGENLLELTLVYNSGNDYRSQMAAIVAQQLRTAGISVQLIGCPTYEEYLQVLQAGDFDLYVGEIDLGDAFHLAPLFTQGEGFGYGTGSNEALQAAYQAFQEGSIDVNEFWEEFRAAMPVLPLLYRQGIAAFDKDYGFDVIATRQNIFYNMSQW